MLLRPSSVAELFDCSLRWMYRHIEQAELPPSGRAAIGTAIHKATAIFDADRASIKPHEAVCLAVDALYAQEDTEWTDKDPSVNDAENFVSVATERYCSQIAPLLDFSAVEKKTRKISLSSRAGTIELQGTADRIIGTDQIADIKSGASIIRNGEVHVGNKHIQLGLYQLLAEAPADPLLIGVNYCKVPAWKVKTVQVDRETTMAYLKMAIEIIASGDFRPNPTSMMCSKKYCPAARLGKCKFFRE